MTSTSTTMPATLISTNNDSNSTIDSPVDSSKRTDTFKNEYLKRRSGSPVRNLGFLDRLSDEDASHESAIDEAIEILSEASERAKRPKTQSLQRRESSLSERSAKELLKDNSDRLSVMIQTFSIRADDYESSDDEDLDE